MKYTKWIWTVVVVIMVVTFVNLRPLHAGENYRKKIILFSEKTKWAEIRAYAVKWEKRGVVISMEVPIINGLVAGVPEGVTDAELAADRRVSSIETNLELSGNDAVKGQGASFIKPLKRPPMVDDAANRYEAPWSVLKLFDQPYDNRYFSGWLTLNDIPDAVIDALGKLNETKTSIAVFDTGIDDIHHYTRDIVQKGVNVDEFSENDGRLKLQEEDSYDDNGHGSHIAGILGAILDREHSWGQEADIDLNSIKVLGDDGMGYLSNIIYGLQWAIDHDIRIANMSIGYRQDSPAVRRAVKEASKAGIIMLASVGNKSNYDPNVTLKTTADGASADGASADGASADGASADGASADGASADGASADG
ncbi:S8 family serine peptidase, partial [Desulfococcus sp.]|uniref:S8 family serine peptidase n=1 Tax=Desulfococcus sp. TaxID=2025834 RepID=UPI0035948F4D